MYLFARLVDPSPEAFRRFAEDYYEAAVDLGAVRHIYALRPLSQAVIADLAMKDLADDLAAVRFPSVGG
jgi:hypothetical protein